MTISTGTSSSTFTATGVADSSTESDETLTATLAGSTSTGTATVSSTNSATLTFLDNTAPAFSNLGGSVAFSEDGTAVVLDSNVTVADTELDAANSSNGDYNGASLTLPGMAVPMAMTIMATMACCLP